MVPRIPGCCMTPGPQLLPGAATNRYAPRERTSIRAFNPTQGRMAGRGGMTGAEEWQADAAQYQASCAASGATLHLRDSVCGHPGYGSMP